MKYGEEAVYALPDLLNEHEVSYMLVGSFSSNAYGEARATKDADFDYIREWCAQLELLEALAEAESRATSH